MEFALSVIIPVYNRDYIIGKTLDSMFRQTLENIEVIVVDDGSSDDSVEIVKEYQKLHKNLAVYAADHNGPGAARNVGLEHARGEYVTFMDSDDWAPETAYEKMYQLAKDRDADIVVGQYLRKINGGEWFLPKMFEEFSARYGEENCVGNGAMVISVRNPNGVNKLFRRSMLEENHICFPSARMAEDMSFTVSAFECAKRVYYLDEAVYMYETDLNNSDSLVSVPSAEVVNEGIAELKKLGLSFHERGMIEEQELTLEHSFQFVLTRFDRLPSGREKNEVFENIKDYVKLYVGLKEYRITLEYLFQMDIDTMLLLPYPAYENCKKLIMAAAGRNRSAPSAAAGANAATLEATLRMYRNGQAGLRYILRYFKAWLRYKLRGK